MRQARRVRILLVIAGAGVLCLDSRTVLAQSTSPAPRDCGSPASSGNWKEKLTAAGYTLKADGSYVWDEAPVNLLLIPCSGGVPRTQFGVTVGGDAKSTSAKLEQLMPDLMLVIAATALRDKTAKVAFEYIEKADGTKADALRDAMIRWSVAAPWSTIGEEPSFEPLKGFDEWLVVGARGHLRGPFLMIGVLRGHVRQQPGR